MDMNRRDWLTAGAAGLLASAPAAAEVAAAAAPGFTTARAARVASELRGPALLDALVKMRGRSDGGLVYGWLRSRRSTVIDGDVTPLCGVVAGAVQRLEQLSDTVCEATILEFVPRSSVHLLRSLEPATAVSDDIWLRAGAPAFSWAECPEEFLAMTRQRHPDLLDDPEPALRSKPA
jgi:hypothetical protein